MIEVAFYSSGTLAKILGRFVELRTASESLSPVIYQKGFEDVGVIDVGCL